MFAQSGQHSETNGRPSQPGLDSTGQRTKIRHALQFVIGKFDVEMLLQSRQQVQSLKAIDAERLEKVVIGGKSSPRHFEMAGGESEDFVKRLVNCRH